jgi:hypothetical protein
LCYSWLPAVPCKCLLLSRLCALITQRSLVQIQPPQPSEFAIDPFQKAAH